ncbi:MAG: HAMP domain-containing protein [Gammaproteobacteria bacterium]|nr:HAMP domain-containing protein [Gammaproteobacteria bacterium]NIR98380.1 HAMP domain-containing protein [Gammaproteobacteria bacterium]NIT64134.1 HAMP domain-containing protein [Gammaproteobacteria bacterium]NIV21071.1 HAMP domain-containing protein [Gammaproteobacteria bacterium]NIY32714.1 HAMP domain-containing protein [Gammaproteobacteria bacterium]
MATSVIKRLTSGIGPVIVLLALLLVSFFLLSYATEQSERFANLYEWTVLINAAGMLVLVVLIGVNLLRLARQYRAGAPGSRLTVRMLAMFVVLAVIPVSIVYYFSLQFLQRGIDSWFDVKVEQALENALELSQASLDLRKRELLKRTEELARELADVTEENAAFSLNDLRAATDATELTLLGQNSRIIAFSSADPSAVVPHRPTDHVLLQVRQTDAYIAVEPVGEAGLQVRVALEVPGSDSGSRYLQALYPITERFNALADSVQSSFAQYKALAYQRRPLKNSFLLTLSLILMLSLLAAVWAAFYSARRLVAPIRDLAEGTRAVAEGDYGKRLPLAGHDELGFLVRSFNDMTRRIAQASREAQHSQQQVEEQRAYLGAVLAHLSSGVITLDGDGTLRTANAAAVQILGVALGSRLGQPLWAAGEEEPHIKRFVDALRPHLDARELDWSDEIVLFTGAGRQVLMCRGTNLLGEAGGRGDYVVVFDDVTALVQAQRDAAWGEVARRLAHEIKNPLTPIQLSAERLRHKYLASMPERDARVLDRATHTIVQQVEAMKEMVNAFSEYARAPRIRLEPLDLNQLVKEVMDLYSGLDAGVRIDMDMDKKTPIIEADSGRLRQLLHNLVKNGLEAMHEKTRKRLDIRTRCIDERGGRYVELEVRDHGAGFPPEAEGRFFEPYVTTKPKGTGLGLAIVKKIVEEHGGMVSAGNVPGGGARIAIRLPAVTTEELGGEPHRRESGGQA